MNLIKHKHIFLGASSILVLVSWILVATLDLKQGIDLKAGAEWRLTIQKGVSAEEIKTVLRANHPELNPIIKTGEKNEFVVRLPEIKEEAHQAYLETIKKTFGETEEVSFSNIGPTIGTELRKQSIQAIIAVLLGISLYIAWAFRKVSNPITSWKYGVVTLLTLFHDVSIPTGLLAFLGWYKGIEIDTNFIVALLVVIGFSVHDTIVVFDRIRERLATKDKKDDMETIINKSVQETMVRSINTSLTLVLILLAVLFFGPSTLYYFILTILVGTIIGTYSSIFVASPLIYIWRAKEK